MGILSDVQSSARLDERDCRCGLELQLGMSHATRLPRVAEAEQRSAQYERLNARPSVCVLEQIARQAE